ncbi:cytosolic phospholipase A2 zeta [Apiospora kogelbergensis]|uniref:Lysophospholipase n=1 Tax=Apiospora kogelbergensis TaxID=1337665 RepID=A0AAW0QUW6_9PEZI
MVRLPHGALLLGRMRRPQLVRWPSPRSRNLQSAPTSSWASRLQNPLRSATLASQQSQQRGRQEPPQCPLRSSTFTRALFTSPGRRPDGTSGGNGPLAIVPAVFIIGGLLVYSFYPGGHLRHTRLVHQPKRDRTEPKPQDDEPGDKTAWSRFVHGVNSISNVTDIEWSSLSDRLVNYILPEWSKDIPANFRKLQRELSMAPGSLSDDIWRDAHDAYINPEIRYSAEVRVSDQLCDEEKEFLSRRKKVATAALAQYLAIDERDVHPDDVPTIAVCGSGGGLRAMVAGAGSLLATQDDGLFDCVTYTSGVSGSCWLQALYHSSITGRNFHDVIDHLKNRLGVHIAYPPTAFSSILSAPTNKLLLSSLVEKLRGDPNAVFGLVDVYGILLGARLLVPKGELGVDDRDFKMSNQRNYVKYGQNPLPIYTAVRHEIPDLADSAPGSPSQDAKELAKQEAWFQWFEMTPYEFFCEEFSAGIPTWAIGRRFNEGKDVPPESGFHLPEMRMPILMGIYGSAFCATLSHYYREVRPLVRSLMGFGAIDDVVNGRNEDLEKVHPIDPAQIPNFVYGMSEDKLRFTTPTNVHSQEYIQLMDAGMSNNLPIYPLLRPGRDVDVIIAFDASADIKTDNWLSVTDGYARQRGIKGWPVGTGWPQGDESPEEAEAELNKAEAHSNAEADSKLLEAQQKEAETRDQDPAEQKAKAQHDQSHPEDSELGYCTIWVGTTQEQSSEPPPPSKLHPDHNKAWEQLRDPGAGIAVVYLPFMANPKVADVDPAKSDYMSTWNFVYTPEQIDRVVALARANYDEGKEQIRGCIRAIYERKRHAREAREAAARERRQRRLMRMGKHGGLPGEGDHFS